MPIAFSLRATSLLAGFALLLAAPTLAHAQEKRQPVSRDLPSVYQHWLDEDVRYIITAEERAAFVQLSQNKDRDRFVEQFWQSRGPKFKEQHYRRIAYANTHFAAATAGWRTDRGRIYILYGPPDSVRVPSPSANGDSAPPTEIWHYRSSSQYGADVDLKFVDLCKCGEYRLMGTQEKLR